MVTSMTGYGRSCIVQDNLEVIVEIRSVNNRFLDLSLKFPRSLSVYEQKIREIVGSFLNRGRVNIWIQINGDNNSLGLDVDKNLLKNYLDIAKQISKEYDIRQKIDINQLLLIPDVLISKSEPEADEKAWNCVQLALKEALNETVIMRQKEGEEIKKDFTHRLELLRENILKIERLALKGPEQELSKLKERVRKLIEREQLDEYRLECEMALIADRIDITEECTRFNSHIKMFFEILDEQNSQGRRLNFLLQEMNREANTMSSKSYTSEISHLVVKIKEEIEKIREQVQNVE